MAAWPHATGEMAAHIRERDWTSTPLGHPDRWAAALRTAVEMMLETRVVASLAVGPQRLFLYNDAAAPHYGRRHPDALGRPLAEVFAHEVRHVAPFYDRAFAGEGVHVPAQPLDPGQAGADEVFEAVLTPVRDVGGEVIAVLMTGFARGLEARAEAALRESESRHRLLLQSLAKALWETDASGVVVTDSPSWRAYTGQTLEKWLGYGWLDAIHPDDRAYAERQWREAVAARRLVDAEFRLRAPDGGWRWTNVRAAPVLDACGEIEKWAGINIDIDARKRAEEALRESEDRQAFLLRLTDALRSMTDASEMRAVATKRLGERLEVMRASFFEIDADQENFSQGVSYEAGSFHLPLRMRLSDFDSIIADAYRAGRNFVVCDTETDPRLADKREAYRAINLRAWIATPLVSQGRLYSVLGVNHDAPREWTASEITLVDEVGDRLWSAVERAHAEAALRESEARQAFLLELSDTLRPLVDADEIQRVAARLAAEHWGMEGANYVRIESRHGVPYAIVRQSYVAEGREPINGDYPLADFPGFTGKMLTGELMIVPEVASDPDLPELDKANWKAMRIATLLSVALVKGGQLVACFAVHGPEPKAWTVADAELLEEIAERTWAAVERARAEAALKESETFSRALLEGIPQLVWRAVDGGHWTWASPQWTEFTGLKEQDSHGFGWLSPVHPDDRDRVKGVWAGAVERGEFHADYRLRHAATHRYRWFQTRASPVRDEAGVIVGWLGTSTDVEDLRGLQERQRVLLHELQHRVRNTLAVVRSLSKSTAQSSGSVAEFASNLEGRLNALARTQVVLTRSPEAGVDLRSLVLEELLAQAPRPAQVTVEGPEITLSAKAAEVLALAVHELATNALKYGALSQPEGGVSVRWSIHEDGGERWLDIAWSESGVRPHAAAPRREGFGTELVTLRVPYELAGRGRLQLRPDGMQAEIAFPLRPGESILQTNAPEG